MCPLLIGALAFGYTRHEQPLYEAQAKLFVDPSGDGQYDYNSILSAQSLTKTYQKLVKNRDVMSAVVTSLGLQTSPDAVAGQVRASADGDTQLLIVSVSDTDPDRAASIANAVAEQFALYVRNKSTSSDGQSLDQLDAAVSGVEDQIKKTEDSIAALEASPDAASSNVQDQIATLNAT